MAGKVRYLIQRDGRYHARIVVPPRLRPILKKSRQASGTAKAARRSRSLPRADRCGGTSALPRSGEPWIVSRLRSRRGARALYDRSLAFDSELRDHIPLYAKVGYPDEDYIEELKAIVAGRLEVDEMPVIFLTNIRQHVPVAWIEPRCGARPAFSHKQNSPLSTYALCEARERRIRRSRHS